MILTSSDTESSADGNTGDCGIIMKLVHFFQLMSLVIDLEEKSILTADVDSSDFSGLFDGIWVVKMILKVENCENSVSGVMIQNHGRSRQVLVLDSPESDVLFST